MKTILIVDIPNASELDDIIAIGKIEIGYKGLDGFCSKYEFIDINDLPLKPLPDKIDQGYPCSTYDEGYGDGWDNCINEILGGNE